MTVCDIHTHNLAAVGQAVVNAELTIQLLEFDGMFSCGIHPWNVEQSRLENDLSILESALKRPNVVAIGECGLDSLHGPGLELQEQAFIKQAMLARQYDRPMILHVVRQIDSIIRIRKTVSPCRPWLIHGFRGGPLQMRQLLQSGFWLSFGALANKETLALVPDDRLVLETDGRCDISMVQAMAAQLRGTRVEHIKAVSEMAIQDFLGLVCPFHK